MDEMSLWDVVLKVGPYLLAAAGSIFGVIMRKKLGEAQETVDGFVGELSDVLRESLDIIPALDAAIADPSEETFKAARTQIEELIKEIKDVVAFARRV